MKKIKLLFLILLPLSSFGQYTEAQVRELVKSATEPELIIESSSMIIENRLINAEIIVDKLLDIQPNSANYNYRKGYILLKSKNQYKEAIKYFDKALPQADVDYDFFSITDTTAPIATNFYLGECYHLGMEIEKAKTYFTTFLNLSTEKSDLTTLASVKIIQCNNAIKAIETPKKTKLINIGNSINSEYPDYSPVISLDGKALYFTSRRPWKNNETESFKDPLLNNYPEDIYISYKGKNNQWGEPKRLPFCQPAKNEATIALNSDQKRIYVYEDLVGSGDIYYSDLKTNIFQNIEPLQIEGVNSKYWETHITVTVDGLNMYFVSDRPGGFGGRDIYRIVKLPDGTWSEPKNLGPTINTPYDEDAPFIGSDNKTLYYASNGPESIGGFDLFLSVRNEDNVWSAPVNMGFPINSTGDDIFFTTTIDGSKGYFTSYRPDGNGDKDIYEITNDELGEKYISIYYGEIKTTPGTNLPEDLHIIFSPTDSLKEIVEVNTIKDGKFNTYLDTCSTYNVYYISSNKSIFSEKIETKCTEGREDFYRGMYYDPIVNKIIDLNNENNILIEEKDLMISQNLLKNLENQTINTTSRDTNSLEKFSDDEKLVMTKVKVGNDLNNLIDLNPIYFDLDKSNILPEAALELDKIVKILNNNPQLSIKLLSYTDCRGSDAYNLNKSKQRANSTKAYITSRISNPYRVSAEGLGEANPVQECDCNNNEGIDCTDEEHKKNRRTEFIIVEM